MLESEECRKSVPETMFDNGDLFGGAGTLPAVPGQAGCLPHQDPGRIATPVAQGNRTEMLALAIAT